MSYHERLAQDGPRFPAPLKDDLDRDSGVRVLMMSPLYLDPFALWRELAEADRRVRWRPIETPGWPDADPAPRPKFLTEYPEEDRPDA